MQPVVELIDISKSFPGVAALSGVSLALRAARIHALVGENGAGKSTLLNILAGSLPPDAGEVRLDGRAACRPLGRRGADAVRPPAPLPRRRDRHRLRQPSAR